MCVCTNIYFFVQTLEMETIILDQNVLDTIVKANEDLQAKGYKPNQGVRMRLTDDKDNQLFFGDVHPNVQYEYEIFAGSKFTLCVMLSDMAFAD